MILFGLSLLAQRQANRDNTTDCFMYRYHANNALKYTEFDMPEMRDAHIATAAKFKRAGKCSKL